jgi:hypothetical protein
VIWKQVWVTLAVARVEHRDAAREIDVAAAFAVPEERVLRAFDEHRVDHGYAARDGGLAPGYQ